MPSPNEMVYPQKNSDFVIRVSSNPGFRALVKERFAWRLTLSAIVLASYFSFILLVAFSPSSLAHPVIPNSVVSLGIVLGLGLMALCFVLTAIYVVRANKRFATLTHQVLKEVKDE